LRRAARRAAKTDIRPARLAVVDNGGITRLHIIEIARELGYTVEERAFALADITIAAPPDCEVFTASTLKDLLPVVRVGAYQVGDGTAGKVTLTVLDRFRQIQAALVGLPQPQPLTGGR
jgi:hypothetical protein